MRNGVNLNQGAESVLSFLLSLLAVVESFAIIDKIKANKDVSVPKVGLIEKAAKKPASIKSIPAKSSEKKTETDHIVELT